MEDFWERAHQRMIERYGKEANVGILDRFYSEKKFFSSDLNNWFLSLIGSLAMYAEEQGELISFFGGYGSLFSAYLAGITEVNPLPLHYYCPHCRRMEYVSAKRTPLDLEEKRCTCGTAMLSDGYDIPFELVWELKESPCARIEVTQRFLERAKEFVKANVGEKYKIHEVLVTDKECANYLVIVPLDINPDEISCDLWQLVTSYPCVCLLVSQNLGVIEVLEKKTGISQKSISLRDDRLLRRVLAGEVDTKASAYSERWVSFVQSEKPKTVAELIKIHGLLWGENAYEQNRMKLIANGHVLEELPIYREELFADICKKMRKHGAFGTGLAAHLTTVVRQGKGEKYYELLQGVLKELDFDAAYIDYLVHTRYMFVKACGIALIRRCMRLLWYSIYAPKTYRDVLQTISVEQE